MPTVSVIIPSYNRAHLLPRSLAGVLAQTFKDFELLVVDDASNDATQQVVQSYDDRRIQYIRHPRNKGGAAARNTGIERAASPFTAFCDSDDEWLDTKLEKQLQCFEKGPDTTGVIYTGYEKIDWPRQPPSPRYKGDMREKLLVRNWVGSTSTPVIRTELLRSVDGFDPSLPSCQDWDLWIRLSKLCNFDFIDEILVRYYHQATSISMDRRASILGHTMITRKFAEELNALSRPLRARHHFNLAVNFWWKKAYVLSLRHFGLGGIYDPTVLPDTIGFLSARLKNKPARMLHKTRP